MKSLHIIGGGLAGSEAAWQCAHFGCPVILHEMRPNQMTEAHKTHGLAELVCSNSFRSDDAENNAVGVLHEEMRLANSLIMSAADAHKLPAGGALAVDRDLFSERITQTLEAHELITIERGEVDIFPEPDWGLSIIATGPLTSEALSNTIQQKSDEDALAFFDAIAPIIHKDSIDFDKVWFQSRYDKPGPGGTGADYINCALDQEQYEHFIDQLLKAEQTDFHEWEKNTPYFDGCLPIEVMAQRGRETLRHGPMKPVGLTNPHKPDEKPYAVVQLRQDNQLGTLWNMVGFQTKIKYGAQTEIFKSIPGLENASFARLGGLHRNSFLNSPKLLDGQLRFKAAPHARFAGQITGVEGYVESAATGLLAAYFTAAELHNITLPALPATTAHGALLNHITQGHLSDDTEGGTDANETTKKPRSFQPMNVNFGLFPAIDIPKAPDGKRYRGKEKGRAKKQAMARRALYDMAQWQQNCQELFSQVT